MAQIKKIRVLIVDDHGAVRSGLGTSLKAFNDITPVAEASNGIEAIYLCSRFQPDVVLMDLNMNELDGVSATWVIRHIYEHTQVIVLANFSDEEVIIQEALHAGAIGCLRKDVGAETMAETIRTAYMGKTIPWATV